MLGFNVKILDDAQKESQERGLKIFTEKIIYNLVRNYTDWVTYQREHEESIVFNELPPICKFQFMKGFIFRRNDPAVFGAEVHVGKLRQKVYVMIKMVKRSALFSKYRKAIKLLKRLKKECKLQFQLRALQLEDKSMREICFIRI